MIKTLMKAAAVISSTLVLAACGERVEVPSAHVAKIMGPQGYKENIIPTSKFRLDFCVWYCDKLVLLDASDRSVQEEMVLFMPEDKLNMTFDIRMTLMVNPNKYESIFNMVPPNRNNDRDYITWDRIYQIYGQQIVRSEAREFLSQFTIAEIASSREAINAELSARLTKMINEKTPFVIRYVALADVQYPDIIVRAQENAAERREQIQQEEAQREISKVQLERQLQEQRMQRMIDVEKAEAEAQVNKILADSVTQTYVKYRELTILEQIANSENKVFVPMGMLDSIAGQVQLGRQ